MIGMLWQGIIYGAKSQCMFLPCMAQTVSTCIPKIGNTNLWNIAIQHYFLYHIIVLVYEESVEVHDRSSLACICDKFCDGVNFTHVNHKNYTTKI